jgi:4-hydroxy-tetrahydrodipicolinate synthase
MVYNNPVTTGIDMKPALLAQLAVFPTIRYVKESTKDVRRVEEIHRRSEGQLQVFAGIHAFESFLVGAIGWVSVPANVAPASSARLYDAVHAGALEEARGISSWLWDLMELEDATGKYVQLYKRALELMGRPAGPPRAPRLRPPPTEEEALLTILQNMGLLGMERGGRL